MKIGIIGMGVVGKAQSRLFAHADQVTYDPALNDSYPFADLQRCDFAVIAVGTPALKDGGCDLSQVHAAWDRLPIRLPVIIRSTVPPGTTAKLARHRDAHVAVVPEFLHEREGAPWPQSADVPFMICGGQQAARNYFWPFLAKVFPGQIHGCRAVEAELIKYTANLYSAMRVTFVNEMARICSAYGEDWGAVREGWLCDPRIDPDYTAYKGFPPGFGGACWPKDLSALIAASRRLGYEPGFLQAIEDANARFTA